MPAGHCIAIKEATGKISLNLRGGIRIEDKIWNHHHKDSSQEQE